jgi:hypothetical protein
MKIDNKINEIIENYNNLARCAIIKLGTEAIVTYCKKVEGCNNCLLKVHRDCSAIDSDGEYPYDPFYRRHEG